MIVSDQNLTACLPRQPHVAVLRTSKVRARIKLPESFLTPRLIFGQMEAMHDVTRGSFFVTTGIGAVTGNTAYCITVMGNRDST